MASFAYRNAEEASVDLAESLGYRLEKTAGDWLLIYDAEGVKRWQLPCYENVYNVLADAVRTKTGIEPPGYEK